MNPFRRWMKPCLMFLGVVLLNACGGGGSGGGDINPVSASIARVAITPGTALLTEVGATRILTAQAFDASGNPLPATFTWTSSKPEVVTSSSDGKITAAALGSAQIVAEAEGIRSAAALVAVSMPALGVVVIEDNQVVSAPSIADPAAEFDVGMQYQVTLSGIAAPAAGTLISGTGEQPVAGRVVAAQESGGNVIVTLEVVPVADLFPSLAINETIDLSMAKIVVPPEVTEHFTVTQQPDGRMELTPKAGDTVTFSGGGDAPAVLAGGTAPRSAAAMTTLHRVVDPLKKEFKVGPIDCEANVGFPLIHITIGKTGVDSNLIKDIQRDSATGALTRLALLGDVKVEGRAQVLISTAVEGAVECKMKLGEIPVPLPGPLAVLYAHVPISLGLGAGGKLSLANLGYEAFASASGSMTVGLSCPDPTQDCEFLHALDGGVEGKTQPIVPPAGDNLDTALRIEPEFSLFGHAALAVKPLKIEQLKAELFAVKFGPKIAANLSTVVGQLADSNYKSDYKLTIETVAGTGKEIKSILGFLKITVVQAEFKNNVLISQSPAAKTFTTKRTGDAVTFDLALDPQTLDWPMFLPGSPTVAGIPIPELLYNVQEIKIFQKKELNGVIEPVLVASQIAADGQTDFVLEGTVVDGANDFFAFVETRFLPLPGVGDLELIGGSRRAMLSATYTREVIKNTKRDGFSSELKDNTSISINYVLRSVSDTVYEGVDGSAQFTVAHDYREVEDFSYLPSCSFTQTHIEQASGFIGVPAVSGNQVHFAINSDGSYSLSFGSPYVQFLMNAVSSNSYFFSSDSEGCPVDTRNEYTYRTSEQLEFSGAGISNPSDATVISGSDSKVNGTSTDDMSTETTTWTLTLQ